MNSELFVLRHSKSDWTKSGFSDYDRPLNARGQHDAHQLANWLKAKSLCPDEVICSTAARARQTLQPMVELLALIDRNIRYEEKLYLASLKVLLRVIEENKPSDGSLMIVGHNPGLDELVAYLATTPPPLTSSGKLMTTSCLARFNMPSDWRNLQHRAELVSITRPGDIAE